MQVKKEHYAYFIEKASMLIRKLIAGQGTAKERLLECEDDIYFVLAIQIPKDLIPKREKIKKDLNKKGDIENRGLVTTTSFRNTLYYMKQKTAAKIILDIYDLYSEVLYCDGFD